jgi:hypothetical protein
MKGGFMQFTIAGHGRYVALSVVIASSLAVLGATGGFRVLVRLGDAAIESYNQAVSDWARNFVERLNPTFPRCI